MNALTLAIVVVVGLVLALLWRLTRTELSCPHCGASKAKEIKRDFRETRDDGFAGITTQQDFKIVVDVTYRCQNCGETFTRIEVDR